MFRLSEWFRAKPRIKVGATLSIDVNGLRNRTHTVDSIRTVRREIGGKTFAFTDYAFRPLGGIANPTQVIRVNPNGDGLVPEDTLLLTQIESFGFSKEVFDCMRQEQLDITEADGSKASYWRLGNLKGPHRATAITEGVGVDLVNSKVTYWDWARQRDGDVTEFLFVEQDGDTAWQQMWRGESVPSPLIMFL